MSGAVWRSPCGVNSAQTTAPQALPMETRSPVTRPAMLEGNTTSVTVPQPLAGIVGFSMDRIVLVLEGMLLGWRRGA